MPSVTRVSKAATGAPAGGRITRPSASRNMLPCAGQVTDGSEPGFTTPRSSGAPWCVHRFAIA